MSETSTHDIPTAPPTASLADAERLPRPRIRTGAVLWGLLLVAAAGVVLWLAATPPRRDDALAAVQSLDAFGWTVVSVVAVGGMLTLLAAAAVIRHVQRRLAQRD